MTTEREFIRILQQRFPARNPVEVGIGDDGSVVQTPDRRQVVVADMLLDGTHFRTSDASPELIGRKAVAVNLSDLAAMACRPTAAYVTLAIPTLMESKHKFLERMYDGIQQLTDSYDFTVAGGDTTEWNGPLAVSVTLTGVPVHETPVLRSGGRPGDLLFVTGALGGSLDSGRHLSFEPRLREAAQLMESCELRAMIDISDGLAIDLHRLTESSHCGATIIAESIPISSDVDNSLAPHARLQHALSDGEDFELLFCAPAGSEERIRIAGDGRSELPVTCIGQLTSGSNVFIRQGDSDTPLADRGWQCFQSGAGSASASGEITG